MRGKSSQATRPGLNILIQPNQFTINNMVMYISGLRQTRLCPDNCDYVTLERLCGLIEFHRNLGKLYAEC